MEKYIYTNKISLSQEICDDLIELFENEERKYDGITHGGLQKNIKDTKDFVIPENEPKWYKYYQLFHNELTRNLNMYINKLNDNEKFKNINQNTTNIFKHFENSKLSHSIFMIQRYKMNEGRYVYHHDFSIDYKNKKNRVLTYLWYLNDVKEGGETDFPDLNLQIKPEAGTLLIFPATWDFPHCGKMPISSNKYIVTGWLYKDIPSE
jgi:Rps23 Pro-64 3,4-dihydroxylase Tpa1-like proline 4-hydroxylase